MRYVIRVAATNSAGTTVAEYVVSTQAGGKWQSWKLINYAYNLRNICDKAVFPAGALGPDLVQVESEQTVPAYLDVGVLLPIAISLLTLIALSAGVFICFRRSTL